MACDCGAGIAHPVTDQPKALDRPTYVTAFSRPQRLYPPTHTSAEELCERSWGRQVGLGLDLGQTTSLPSPPGQSHARQRGAEEQEGRRLRPRRETVAVTEGTAETTASHRDG